MLILLYHGVRSADDVTSSDVRQKHVPEAIFRQQLAMLQKLYTVLPLPEVVHRLKNHTPIPRNTCVITFDDGYANNAEVAAPLLKERGLHATFFVTTDFVDGKLSLWVDRFETAFAALSQDSATRHAEDARLREHLKQLPEEERERTLQDIENRAGTRGIVAPLHRALSWEQVRRLHQDGFEIGAHTKTHPILSRCTPEQREEEILVCKKAIEHHLGTACEHFAYPNGQPSDWNEAIAHQVQHSFSSCCTTVSRFASSTSNVYELPRLTVDTGTSLLKFFLTITGARLMLQRIKHRL